MYVPPDGNAVKAAARITDCVQQQLHKTPGAAVFILGDFNHCKLEQVLTGFEQYVQCVTHDQYILDKCYGNIKKAYRYIAGPKPPLANSDHNIIHLSLIYKTDILNLENLR